MLKPVLFPQIFEGNYFVDSIFVLFIEVVYIFVAENCDLITKCLGTLFQNQFSSKHMHFYFSSHYGNFVIGFLLCLWKVQIRSFRLGQNWIILNRSQYKWGSLETIPAVGQEQIFHICEENLKFLLLTLATSIWPETHCYLTANSSLWDCGISKAFPRKFTDTPSPNIFFVV